MFSSKQLVQTFSHLLKYIFLFDGWPPPNHLETVVEVHSLLFQCCYSYFTLVFIWSHVYVQLTGHALFFAYFVLLCVLHFLFCTFQFLFVILFFFDKTITGFFFLHCFFIIFFFLLFLFVYLFLSFFLFLSDLFVLGSLLEQLPSNIKALKSPNTLLLQMLDMYLQLGFFSKLIL